MLGGGCSSQYRRSIVGRRCRDVLPADSYLSTTERWMETRTSRNDGVVFPAISSHAQSFENLHVRWTSRLSVARWIPRPAPSNGVARSDGPGGGPSGSVRQRWRWNRWYCLVAKRSSLLQGGRGVGHSGFCTSEPTGVALGRTFFVALSIGPNVESRLVAGAGLVGPYVRTHRG
jgi:hypothetical protein